MPSGERTGQTGWRRQTGLLLTGSAGCFIGYVTLATRESLMGFDHGARGWVSTLRSDSLTVPMQILTTLGDSAGLIPLIAVTCFLLWRSCRRWALALPVMMTGAGGLQWLAKWVADRPRPDATPMGFPSGHVLSLVVLFGLIAYLAAGSRHRAWSVATGLVCALTVVSVGFTRLYLDKHWLSDLGGGLAIGLAYLLLAIWLVDVVCLAARAAHRPAEPS